MKVWWIAVVGLMLAGAPARAAEAPDKQVIKGTDGTPLAVLVICNDCQSPAGTGCHGGAEVGWLDGKPCGKCLIDANYGIPLIYPYDLHIAGKLVKPDGSPVTERFVKAFLSNTWSTRTRVAEDGSFRLMLGATADRKSREPLVIDVGTRVDSIKGEDPYYAMFLLPPDYDPCPADAMKTPPAQKP